MKSSEYGGMSTAFSHTSLSFIHLPRIYPFLLIVPAMTSPGTMKTIQKRFYTVVTSNTSNPAISRVRSNSASTSRNLYTANTPLSFFDSPPPPPPSSRPGNPHAISTTRLPVKGDGTGSGEGQQHHTHTTGPQPPFSLALTSPQPNAVPPHTPVGPSYNSGHPFFPYSGFPHPNGGAYIPFYGASGKDHPPAKRQRTRYQLDVGAYGIAKRSSSAKRSTQSHGKPHSHGARLWEYREEDTADDQHLSVQVGEDAYFIRDNAMGVADGVGGWARSRHAGKWCIF